MTAPAFARGDAAVNEVLGFILMFALSAVVLLISLQAFNGAQTNSNDLVAAVELKNLANRISSRIVQAGNVAQEFPEADFRVHVRIPEEIAGYRYTLRLRDRPPGALGINDPNANPIVYVRTEGDVVGPTVQGSVLTGEATIFNVDEVQVNAQRVVLETDVVRSSSAVVTIHYWYATGQGHVAVQEGAL